MEFCSRFPFPLWSHNNLPRLPARHRPSVGARASWRGHHLPHATPAAPMGGSSHRRKEAEVPPCATPPLCCGAPEHSLHQADSAAAPRAFRRSLRAKPTCYSAANHGVYPGGIHSFSGPQSPSQGPPNPVRHLLSRWASSAFWQGFASLCLTSDPPLDWNVECGGGRGRMFTELSLRSFPPAEEWVFYQWLWKCLWCGVHSVFSLAVKKKM